MKNILLLENKYKKKYRNLALMKFSTYFKQQRYTIDFFEGIDTKNSLKRDYEYIVYSTIFTYYFDEDIKTINYYKNKYPNAKIIIGGVSATLIPDKFEAQTGIKPHVGLYEPIEYLKPDYDLFNNHPMDNISEVFSARGCRNSCSFCAVKTLEPEYIINTNWKKSIDLTKPHVMIHDNNLITGDFNHYVEVMEFVKEHNLQLCVDNGFDCRNFTEHHLKHIVNVKFERSGLRFAFDNMSEDKHIQKSIGMCLDSKIAKNKIMVFCLFNYTDTFEEAMYRFSELRNLGVRPYPQQYRPLDDTGLHATYISPNWNKQLLRDFRFYWMMPGIFTRQNWNTYISNGGAKQYH